MNHVISISGGKDSTAMAMALCLKGEKLQLPLWEEVDPTMKKCRVCSL